MPGESPFALVGPQERLRPMKMSDQVARHIRRMIAHGELHDGDSLPTEAELIQRFGVSRPTLREAFRLLEGDSLVTIRRGPPGGARVTIPRPNAVADLFGMILMLSGTTVGDVWDARVTIEPPAVGRLAKTATKETLKALDVQLEGLRAAVGDPREFNRASMQYHVKLVELSGNHTLAAVIDMLSEITQRELAKSATEFGPAKDEVNRTNRRTLHRYEKTSALIHAGDSEGAERAWLDHLKSARRCVMKIQKHDRVVDLLY